MNKTEENEERLVLTEYGWLDTETGIIYATDDEFYKTMEESNT